MSLPAQFLRTPLKWVKKRDFMFVCGSVALAGSSPLATDGLRSVGRNAKGRKVVCSGLREGSALTGFTEGLGP